MTSNCCFNVISSILFLVLFLSLNVSNTVQKQPAFVCFGKKSTNPAVCSGNGDCIANGMCACKMGFYGPQCQMFNCFQYPNSFPLVCSSKGVCSKPNTCECMTGWIGPDCSKQNQTIVTPPTNNSNNSTNVIGKVQNTKVSDLNSKKVLVNNSTKIEFPPTIEEYLEKQGLSRNENINVLTTFENSKEFSSGITSITFTFPNGSLIPVNGLVDPIQIEFYNLTYNVNSSTFDLNNLNFTCAYFDEFKEEWLTYGLETILSNVKLLKNNTVNLNIDCKTKHLTRFTIIDRNIDKANQNRDVVLPDLPRDEQTILIVAITLPAAGACLISCLMFILAVSISIFMMKRRRKKEKPMNQP